MESDMIEKTSGILFLLILGASVVFVGCGDKEKKAATPVVVASKIDTEGALLGQMIVKLLEANGIKVEDKTEFGPTGVVRKAIAGGEIDIYPEYTGNGQFFFSSDEPEIWKSASAGFEKVKELDYAANKVVWLTPAPANNTWAIAVRQDLATREGLTSLEDFADFVNRGGEIKIACSEEFASSPAALPAFEAAYGFKLEKDQLLILAGGNTAQTEKAAAEQTDGVNFAMAYGTDGSIAAFNLSVLEDTKGVQPVYEPAPIIRETILEAYPDIESILKTVFLSLDLVKLQTLNGKIVVEGQDAGAVAEEYLKVNGFLK
jgi:osmoprotectant transport system substrate-binding protein